MLHAIEMGWFIINKYYSRTDEVPAYTAAILLDPFKRAEYIKQNWPREWYDNSIAVASEIWEKEYKDWTPPAPVIDSDEEIDTKEPEPKPKRAANEFDRLMSSLRVRNTDEGTRDDFYTFIKHRPFAHVSDGITPLAWWCESIQRALYPRLSRMAIAILSIPAESAEPERVFSGGRRTCSWDRLRLKCNTIEMIECVGNWIHEGFVKESQLSAVLKAEKLDLAEEDKEELEEVDIMEEEGEGYVDWLCS
jgi:hypothetical protein